MAVENPQNESPPTAEEIANLKSIVLSTSETIGQLKEERDALLDYGQQLEIRITGLEERLHNGANELNEIANKKELFDSHPSIYSGIMDSIDKMRREAL